MVDTREFIDEVTLPGAQIQHFSLSGTDYGTLFILRTAWDDSTADKVEQALKIHVSTDAYKVQFDTLDSLLDDKPVNGYRTRRQLELLPYSLKELNLLGSGYSSISPRIHSFASVWDT